MSTSTFNFVQKMFVKYYTESIDEVGIPTSLEKREFAVCLLRNRAMIRHKCFTTVRDLKFFLQADVPSDVYYSSAIYEQPGASEMSAKGWTAADLIFDIDADHIPTSCDRTHDEWTCAKCGFSGKGITPEECPVCGGEKFEENNWLCEVCLNSAKSETIRLLDILIDDFGVPEDSIHVFFSGHRGYHVHVTDVAMQLMDTLARKEIVDYVCGLGFDRTLQRIDKDSEHGENKMWPLSVEDRGWRGHITNGIHDFISNAISQDYVGIGIKKTTGNVIEKNKESILKSLRERTSPKKFKGLSTETWGKARALIIDHVLESKIAHVDTVVTTDIHRLIRLTGTLHNKTGMKKVEFPASTIDRFDPFTSAIAFKEGTTTICVSTAPEFRLGNQKYGPYENEVIELPTAAAMLLICKNRAEVTKQNVH